VRLVIKSG